MRTAVGITGASVRASTADALRDRLAPNSRDRRLLDRQVQLTPETRPALYEGDAPRPAYVTGTLPQLERTAASLTTGARPGLATAAALTRALARLSPCDVSAQDRSVTDILASGEATAIERARALATLATVCGIPARLCLLYRDQQPGFHAVAELRIMASWAVFDPLAGQYYLVTHHPYASAWELMRRPAIADSHPDHGRKPTVDSSFYRTAYIAAIEHKD